MILAAVLVMASRAAYADELKVGDRLAELDTATDVAGKSFKLKALKGKWTRIENVMINENQTGVILQSFWRNVTDNGPVLKHLDTSIPPTQGGVAAALDPRPPYFIACNRGKRSITVDLRKPEGKEVFLALTGRTDNVKETLR